MGWCNLVADLSNGCSLAPGLHLVPEQPQLALDSPAMVLSFILIQNRQWVALSPFGWFGAGD